MRRLVLLGATALALVAPATAAAASDRIGFDGLAAGTVVIDQFQTTPGFLFGGQAENPPGGAVPTDTCGLRAVAQGGAPSAPNVARLECGSTSEVNLDPLVLVLRATTKTRSQLSVEVGDTAGTAHRVRLAAYDSQGRLLTQSAVTTIAGAGTTLAVTTGAPEIAFAALVDSSGNRNPGLWIDDVTADVPAAAGHPAFALAVTAGQGQTRLRQASRTALDLTLYRINGSAGQVTWSFAGLPQDVTATVEPSANGGTLRLAARADAPLPAQTPVVTVTATPNDPATGTTPQAVRVPVVLTAAIELTLDGGSSIAVPGCTPLHLTWDVADGAGRVAVGVDGLPDGVSATLDGAPLGSAVSGSAPRVSGRGSGTLALTTTKALPGPTPIAITAWGISVSDPDTGGRPTARTATSLRPPEPLHDLDPTSAQAPQALRPGTEVTLRGSDLCPTPQSRVRFGNDQALAPVRSVAPGVIAAEVPRLATTGPVQLLPGGDPGAPRVDGPTLKVDWYRNTVGFAFHNYTPDFTFGQMQDAFGKEQTHYSPNVCGSFSFDLIDCKVVTPLPDPWALAVLAIANATMGHEGKGGACFGFSRVSQQLARGTRSLASLEYPNARNAFEGGAPTGAAIQAINAAQLQQLSTEYLDFYATRAVAGALGGDAGDLRRDVQNALGAGDHPQLSLRGSGLFPTLHVVVAYDVENDPVTPGAYFIYVYDSNAPDSGEDAPDGRQHERRQEGSAIHVLGDGSWTLPSSGLSASTVANIIPSGSGMPPEHPRLITAKGALKDGLQILLGWGATALLRSGADPGAAPAAVTQVTAGNRRLYSAPGVVNTDPATALRAAPWSPATGDDATGDGLVLDQGPGAEYTVSLQGVAAGEQTRTLVGEDTLTQITTRARPGATDALTVVPADDAVGFAAGAGGSPLDVQVLHRTDDGSTRAVEVATTTASGGADEVGFEDGGELEVRHRGPAATLALTVSSAPRGGLPQATTAKVRVGRNGRATVRPASWKRLGRTLLVRSGGRTRKVTARAARLADGAVLTRLAIARRTVTAVVRVPPAAAGGASVAFVLRRGRRVLGHTVLPAAEGGTRTLRWTVPGKARRGDRVEAVATTVVRRGAVPGSTASRRQLRLPR